jgi:hypothetical protein
MPRVTFPLPLALLLLSACVMNGAATESGAGAPAPRLSHRAWARQNQIAEIESYSAGLDRYIKRNAARARRFADVSNYENNEPERWQEFPSGKALDKAWQDGKTYKSSNVWFSQSGDLTVTLFTLSSPSGDWVQYVTNYYRADGSLAKLNSELRTFMGGLIVIRNRFYDTGGKQLKETTRYLDLQTRRPKRVKSDEFQDMEIPVYARTGSLPFHNLLKKR